MRSSTLAAVLLAGQILFGAGRLGAAGRRVSRVDPSHALVWLGIAAGIIAVVCLAIRFGSALLHRRRYNSHRSLFYSLCGIHGLDHGARRLLKQVARHRRLAQPARIFTEPRWLNPADLPAALRSRGAEVATLRNRLFG